MRLIDRYIARYVIAGALLALVLLLALFTVIDLVEELEDVGKRDYDFVTALKFLALRTPGKIFQMFPVATLIGSLLGLGMLAASSELTVLRAAGVSTLRIVGAVLKAGVALTFVAVIVGEVFVPNTEVVAHEMRSVAISKRITLQTRHGFWIRDGESFIQVRRVNPDKGLRDVYVYELDEDYRLRVVTRAKTAKFDGESWILESLGQSRIDDDGVVARSIPKAQWRSTLSPEQVSIAAARPEGLSVWGLIEHLRFLAENELDGAPYEIALWTKVIYPITTLVMVFVAIILVLGPLRDVSVGARVLAGIIAGVSFHIIQRTSAHAGLVFEASPFLAVCAPTVVFLVLGVIIMRRMI